MSGNNQQKVLRSNKRNNNNKNKRVRRFNKNRRYYRPRNVRNSTGAQRGGPNNFSSRVRGSEIIYTQGSVITGSVQAIIPCNPRNNPSAVRLYNVARGFQQWKPHYFSVEWVPTCPTTSTGVVQLGTVWSTSVAESAIASALQVSNGGMTGAVYTRLRSNVQLKGRLPQQWFYFNDLSEDSNPFFLAFKCTLANSGYLLLHYDFEFTNPTTQMQSITYNLSAVGDPFLNPDATEIIVRQALTVVDAGFDKTFDPFTRFIKDTVNEVPILRNGVNTLLKKVGLDYTTTNSSNFFRVSYP